MGNIKAIRTDADYEVTLARIDALMDAKPGTPEGEELDVLTDLVEHYDEKHVPMGFPSAIAAIRFRMEQAGLTPRHLVPFLGSRAKVSEVLSGKRPLTMPMARALHEHLSIPAAVLFREAGARLGDPLAGVEWTRFPLKAMVNLGWIRKVQNSRAHAKELVQDLIRRAGGPDVSGVAFVRNNDHARANAKTDPYALKAWCWKVLADATETRPSVSYKTGTVTLDFLRHLGRLSWSEEGPRLAKEFLAKHGIPLVVVPHLPKTHLDGAALKLGDGTPVIGLTLRYDRIDNFWFCLLHELAHVGTSHGERQRYRVCGRPHIARRCERPRGPERAASRRMGGRSPGPSQDLGNERRTSTTDSDVRHQSRERTTDPSSHCGGQGPP